MKRKIFEIITLYKPHYKMKHKLEFNMNILENCVGCGTPAEGALEKVCESTELIDGNRMCIYQKISRVIFFEVELNIHKNGKRLTCVQKECRVNTYIKND